MAFDTQSGIAEVLAAWTKLAWSAASDAGLISGCAAGLPGISGGRYASGSTITPQPAGTTVETAIAALTAARAQIAADIATAESAAPPNIAAAIQAVAADVAAMAQSPTDQVRLLLGMASFQFAVTTDTSPIGASIALAQAAVAASCRQASIATLARATSAYQPTSYDDAVSVLDAVTAALDAEIVSSADAGDDATYLALKALRTAVTQDLVSRGSQLPKLVTVTRGASLPALVLAYQLYGDASRCDDLVARVDPPAPLFMPTAFEALSS